MDRGCARPVAGPEGTAIRGRSRARAAARQRDVEEKWNELKSAEGRSSEYDSLDLHRMSRLVKARALPLPLTEPDLSSVIVSTVHRAKGLSSTPSSSSNLDGCRKTRTFGRGCVVSTWR